MKTFERTKRFVVAAVAAISMVGITNLPAEAVADPCAVTITKGDPGIAVTGSDVTVTPPVSPSVYCVAQFKTATNYSFTVPAGINKVDYLVVGAGGGGASGGGGGGGVRQGTDYSVTPGATLAISVGAGGAGGNGGSAQTGIHGGKGGNSVFATITANGGGGGASNASNTAGIQNGSSGGGSRYDCVSSVCGGGIAGTGIAGQGNNGGYSTYNSYGAGGGGGGAGGAGFNTTRNYIGGRGGDGLPSSITGTTVYYGGGGGGGINNNDNQYIGVDANGNLTYNGTTPSLTGGGQGGLGGGGRGSSFGRSGGVAGAYANAEAGAPNTGGGGGGTDPEDINGGAGGSGTVIVRWVSTTSLKTVTFNSNTASPATTTQLVGESVSTKLNANSFTNPGYFFAGWNTAANRSGTSYADEDSLITATDITLYATWMTGVNHTVTFNVNALSGTSGTMANQTAGTTTALDPNNFSRTNYTFDSWNTAANGSGFKYTDGAVYSFAEDTTLYAQWTPIVATYRATFYGNGAESGSTATQVASTTTALNLNGFTRTGYNFLGWNTNYSAGTASFLDGQNYAFTSDINLYAIWVAQAVNTITYDGNQADSGTMSQQDASSNTQIRPNTFVRDGYTFRGWNTAANGSGTAYLSNYVYSFATSKTLYAQWGANVVVTYNGNTQNTGSAPGQQSTYDGSPGINLALNTGNLTKQGHRLAGWNTQSNGQGTPYALGASSVRFSTNTTLYAQWTPATYALVYSDNGATSGSAPTGTTFTFGTPVNLEANTGSLAKTGYTFEGWNTAADGSGSSYAVSTTNVSLSTDTVLFARWVAIASVAAPAPYTPPAPTETVTPAPTPTPSPTLVPTVLKVSGSLGGLKPNSSVISSALQNNVLSFIRNNPTFSKLTIIVYATSANNKASSATLAKARATQIVNFIKKNSKQTNLTSARYEISVTKNSALLNRFALNLSK